MSQLDHGRASERVVTGLIEADVEIAFSLVDLAEECLGEHDLECAGRVLHDADEVLLDIERRLDVIGREKSWPFDPLLGEVRRAIALARSHVQ